MAHVARTHRVNLDWLLERSFTDPCIFCRYIDTKAQLADTLTKPQFSAADWCSLCELFRLSAPPKTLKMSPIVTEKWEDCEVHSAGTDDVQFVSESRLLADHSMIRTSELQRLLADSAYAQSVRKQRKRAKQVAKAKKITLQPIR